MSTLTQRSFAGGEIAPNIYARVDFNRYQTSLRTCRNFIVQKHGGAANRSGTQFIGVSRPSRLIPFSAGLGSNYIVDFDGVTFRFIKNNSYILDAGAGFNILSITNNAAGLFTTASAHGYLDGDQVVITGLAGTMGERLNNRYLIVNLVGATQFRLIDFNGSILNTTDFGLYAGAPVVKRVYSVKFNNGFLSGFTSTAFNVFDIQYSQSVDVMTLVCKSFPPLELKRFSDTNWTLAAINFKPDVTAPNNVAVSAGTGTRGRQYKVTAIRKDDFKESSSGLSGFNFPISAISKTNPATVSTGSGGANDGDEVYIAALGMTEVNDRRFFVTNLTGGGFQLQGEDSTDYASFISGSYRATAAGVAHDNISVASPLTISWDYPSSNPPAQEFNVYRRDDFSGSYGLIGVTKGSRFVDIGITPDTKNTPPSERNPFLKSGDYPSVINYFQQRLIMANTSKDPEKIFTSKIGDFKNFGVSSPIQDDDSVTFKLSGRQLNEVRHLLDLGQLVAFTSGGEYIINGNESSALTPTSINTKQQSYNGANKLAPIVVNGTALYVQDRGSVIRDIAFRFDADGYQGDDISIFASHLFEGFTIIDWCYSQIPNSTVWAVRSDGVLLGLTYLKEQRVLAWHKHDFTDGLVESVASISSTDKDEVYFLIKRTVNGTAIRTVEKFSTRFVDDIKSIAVRTVSPQPFLQTSNFVRTYDAVPESTFLDSFLTYEGRNFDLGKFVKLTSTAGYTVDDDITLSPNFVGAFTAADVGNSVFVYTSTGDVIRCEITEFLTGGSLRVIPNKDIPLELQDVLTTHWARAVDKVSGLFHLEGKKVSVFADGFVQANPNNPSYGVISVLNGSITLPKPAALIHVGLPYTSDIETLNIDTPSGETIADKNMIVLSVNVFVEKSRGGFVGSKPPPDGILGGLFEFKIRNTEDYASPINLTTGVMEVTIDGDFNNNGRVFLRQTDPLPFTVLSIQPAGNFPFKG